MSSGQRHSRDLRATCDWKIVLKKASKKPDRGFGL
jgi:hypothetical protein